MITLTRIKNAYLSDPEMARVRAAIALINMAMGDNDFITRFLAIQCTEMKGMTNAQALAKLKEDQDITIQGYTTWPWSKVLGYFSSGITIYVNRRKLGMLSAVELASLIFHEYSHEEGFSHWYKWSTSLPYTINRTFEAWALARSLSDSTIAAFMSQGVGV